MFFNLLFIKKSGSKNNQVYYTATAKVEPYDKTVFGATYVSNEWDSETGKGVITFDKDVTVVGNNAFYLRTSLTSVTIPDSVTTIGSAAFYLCQSLTSITIPDSVTSIGSRVFNGCHSLATVYCKRTTPPTGGGSMFDNNASDRKIYVPASDDDSIINAYKATNYWSDYADYIEEYEF